ncbi:hypothetical protein PoB_000626600 [Plakobranchus ocellatus]|uniref:Uncharacterized protein n=1 Tax=Plakobranchus ocellatus TaxID=259542 RepID=A0AAV3XXS2_9GAST|nr:hypothetical protein PoB_000626600 [Plakobranchus ocellatus]
MRSGTWRHLESASLCEFYTAICPQMQIWCGGEWKMIPHAHYVKASRPQNMFSAREKWQIHVATQQSVTRTCDRQGH